MTELVVRIVLEAHSRGRRPFSMLLRNTFLGDACQFQLLAFSQLRYQWSHTVWVADDGVANPLVGAHLINHQVAGIDLHDLALSGALRVEGKLDAAELAVLLAFAVTGIDNIVGILRVERDQPQSVCDELIGQNTAVLLDFDQVNSDGRDFSEDDSTQRVREGKLNIGKIEVDVEVIRLPLARALEHHRFIFILFLVLRT